MYKVGIRYFSFLLFACTGHSLYAQTDKMIQKYEDFKKEAYQKYDDFRMKANEDYARFLQNAWEQFHGNAPVPRPKQKPIPPVVAPDEKNKAKIEELQIPDFEKIVPVNPTPQPRPIAPIKEVPSIDNNESIVDFSYLGTRCSIRVNKNLDFHLSACSNEELADNWRHLSKDGLLNNTIRDCLIVRMELNLCDWAYLAMLCTFARQIYGDSNEATMLMAYIYCQSGYKMRIGRNQGKLYMLFASNHALYDYVYFYINGERFYPLDGSSNKMEICDANYPNEQVLSLQITDNLKLAYDPLPIRSLASKESPNFSINVQVNKNLLEFYKSYPASELNDNFMTKWAMYACTPLEENLKQSLYPAMKKMLAGCDKLAAATMLLNWVQTAFVYGYDDDIWGYDRSFFAEETLFYPYSDCEDRSILFSHLVRDLLNLDVALVYSPGHLFTAVCFDKEVNGAYFMVDGRKFVICEPTSTSAVPVGWSSIKENTEDVNLIVLAKTDSEDKYEPDLCKTEYPKSMFPVYMNGRYGYKNANGDIVVPCEFDSVSDFSMGDLFLYAAKKNGLISLYDCNGTMHLDNVQQYIPVDIHLIDSDKENDYMDLHAIIKYNDEWRFTDLVFGPVYDSELIFDDYDMDKITYEDNVYCAINQERHYIKYLILQNRFTHKFGVLDLVLNKPVIPFEYSKISFVDGDKSKVKAYKDNDGFFILSLCPLQNL